MDKIVGYKAFNGDMTNSYGMKFEEGHTYTVDGDIEFGLKGNGFHFCSYLEDTLKFFHEEENGRLIARVTGYDEILKREDRVFDYYDMYVARTLFVDKILTREEIIGMVLKFGNVERIKRFLTYFTLTEEEKELFRIRFADNIDVLNAISYYQDNDKDVYNRFYLVKK